MTTQPTQPRRRGYMVDISFTPWNASDGRIVRADIEAAIANFLTPTGQRWIGVYVDGDAAVAQAMVDFRLTPAQVADVYAGSTVRKLAPTEVLFAYIGHDAAHRLWLPS